jgi:hypothetical protein
VVLAHVRHHRRAGGGDVAPSTSRSSSLAYSRATRSAPKATSWTDGEAEVRIIRTSGGRRSSVNSAGKLGATMATTLASDSSSVEGALDSSRTCLAFWLQTRNAVAAADAARLDDAGLAVDHAGWPWPGTRARRRSTCGTSRLMVVTSPSSPISITPLPSSSRDFGQQGRRVEWLVEVGVDVHLLRGRRPSAAEVEAQGAR